MAPQGDLLGQSVPVSAVMYSKARTINVPNFVPFRQPVNKILSAAELCWFRWNRDRHAATTARCHQNRVATVRAYIATELITAIGPRRDTVRSLLVPIHAYLLVHTDSFTFFLYPGPFVLRTTAITVGQCQQNGRTVLDFFTVVPY